MADLPVKPVQYPYKNGSMKASIPQTSKKIKVIEGLEREWVL